MAQAGYGQAPTPELLDDLCTRFILNVPTVELESFEKLMFLVEQAHWYYEDFCRAKDPALRSMSLRAFSALVFQRCPGLTEAAQHQEAIYQRFTAFKNTVPAMGTILLNPAMDKCLLARGFGNSSSWGFPAGKVSKDETDAECAVRETLEETGFNAAALLVEGDFIEVHTQQKRRRMFIITDVPESTPFAPLMRGEIGGYAWHSVAELPATQEASTQAFHTPDGARHKFHMVWPFIKQLRAWIARRRKRLAKAGPGPPPPQVSGTQAAAAGPGQRPPSADEHSARGFGSRIPVHEPSKAPAPAARSADAEPALTKHVLLARPALQLLQEAACVKKESAEASVAAQAAEEPGQTWLAFRFDRAALARALLP